MNKFLNKYLFSQIVKNIIPKEAAKPLGPYCYGKIVSSQANLIFLSGQIGVDPQVERILKYIIRQEI